MRRRVNGVTISATDNQRSMRNPKSRDLKFALLRLINKLNNLTFQIFNCFISMPDYRCQYGLWSWSTSTHCSAFSPQMSDGPWIDRQNKVLTLHRQRGSSDCGGFACLFQPCIHFIRWLVLSKRVKAAHCQQRQAIPQAESRATKGTS